MKNEKYIRPPHTMKIEHTEGCNLRCKFCPTALRPHNQKQRNFLTPDTARLFASQAMKLCPNARLEMAMRGEPTLNPHLFENLQQMRARMAETQFALFSNGMMLINEPDLVPHIFQAGLNILNIDCYNNTYDRFVSIVQSNWSTWQADLPELELEDFREFSAYKKHPKGWKLCVVNLVPDISSDAKIDKVRVRNLHNYGGNSSPDNLVQLGWTPKELPMKKNCARPHREVVVLWNGDVVLCCLDWDAECVLGNIHDKTLRDIWYGDFHLQILRDLWRKDRSGGSPCNKCDYRGGYRLGLMINPFTGEQGGPAPERKLYNKKF